MHGPSDIPLALIEAVKRCWLPELWDDVWLTLPGWFLEGCFVSSRCWWVLFVLAMAGGTAALVLGQHCSGHSIALKL